MKKEITPPLRSEKRGSNFDKKRKGFYKPFFYNSKSVEFFFSSTAKFPKISSKSHKKGGGVLFRGGGISFSTVYHSFKDTTVVFPPVSKIKFFFVRPSEF